MSQYELKLIDRRPSFVDLRSPFIFRKELRLTPFLFLAFAFYHLAFYKRASASLLQNNIFCTAPSRRIADL